MRIRVVSDVRIPKRKIQIEGEFDEYNLPEMRKTVSKAVSRLLRNKTTGHILIQETKDGLTKCTTTISVDHDPLNEGV